LAVERLLSLRQRKILPRLLVEDLEELADPIDRFNPAAAYQSCLDQPSPAARVVTAMLMRTGQPLADIERAARESLDREADRSGSPIRWLSLAAAATPLMGLLGTVWGMIVAFHESTTLTPDRSRSEQLSEGIYTALVTTLAGLIVAIPAAMMALYLENRLAKLYHQVEEFAFSIAPGLSRFAGHRRMDTDGTLHPIDRPLPPPSETPQPPPPPRKATKKRGGAKAG
jgi:biopolymer transport protein ExbB